MIKRIKEYLNNRLIDDTIIKLFQIDDGVFYNKFWISIPIFDESGNKIFTKLRRDPIDSKNLSKYKYFPAGNSPVLYGSHLLDYGQESIYVCEGEFDCLVLKSQGLNAVSSTSGSGTFKDKWVDILLKFKNVYICFDNDSAGQKGALKVYRKIIEKSDKRLNIFNIELPESLDVTDYYLQGSTIDQAITNKLGYVKLKKGTERLDYLDNINYLQALKREYNHNIFTVKLCNDLIDEQSKKLKRLSFTGKNNHDIEDIKKNVPIDMLLDTKPIHKSPNNYKYICPIHNEKTASFVWYKDSNSFYCFGCGEGGSIIDLYMNINKCEVKEAIKELSKMYE
jgi:DNA primase